MSARTVEQMVASIKDIRIQHRAYKDTVSHIHSQANVLVAGEIMVVVGPSRVGKGRAVFDAMDLIVGRQPKDESKRPFIYVTCENSQAEGGFSTRGFMLAACRAINHPIYGSLPSDTAAVLRMEMLIARTPEALLRDAFEGGLKELGVKYLVFDEAHHVGYAKGGNKTALKILDSWKCLAANVGLVLILVGSYKLFELINLVPHLVGRQRPIEFPRYRGASASDIVAFEQILVTFSAMLPFANPATSLRSWNKFLFEKSVGCIGHLSLWLRSALALMESRGEIYLTEKILNLTAFLPSQLSALVKEIEDGEISMYGGMPRGEPYATSDMNIESQRVTERDSVDATTKDVDLIDSAAKINRKPFHRATLRNPRVGRV